MCCFMEFSQIIILTFGTFYFILCTKTYEAMQEVRLSCRLCPYIVLTTLENIYLSLASERRVIYENRKN